MSILNCATLVVDDAAATAARYETLMGYRTVEQGVVSEELARSWASLASAGRRVALCYPASRTEVYLRFVEGDTVADYRPMRTLGWAAIELCVADVEAVAASVASSPFAVIGPPMPIGGLPTIRPMQVRGPDNEIIFLTEILTDDPAEGLPRAVSLIDHLFIQVLACRDLDGTARWFADSLGLAVDATVAIRYSTINSAFDLPADTKHRIVTIRAGGRIVVELDQYPAGVVERPRRPDALPPGVAIATLVLPDLAALRVDWLAPPVPRDGTLYRGRRAGVTRTPEGALLELIEG